MTFDITTWYRYCPTTEMCLNCHATFQAAAFSPGDAGRPLRWNTKDGKRICPVCGFVHEDETFLSQREAENEPNLKELARIGWWLPPHQRPEAMLSEPLALVFQAINAAKWYIHFVTYSIDSTILGALQMASHKAKVRGIVGNLNDYNRTALESVKGLDVSNPSASLAILTSSTTTPMIDGVHNKMLFIDGVLAIKGSANLTLNGYSKASRNSLTESIEAVTKPDDVAELNNTYFARIWAQNTRTLTQDDVLPF